jgi:hypothetical protein
MQVSFYFLHGADPLAFQVASPGLCKDRLGNKSLLNLERFFHRCPQIPLDFRRITHRTHPTPRAPQSQSSSPRQPLPGACEIRVPRNVGTAAHIGGDPPVAMRRILDLGNKSL